MTDPESLSSFKFALSIRSSAPRIEAHYQFYNTTIKPMLGSNDCAAWIEVAGNQYCDPQRQEIKTALNSATALHSLPFDRTLGSASGSVPVTLYADISSNEFREFHWLASKAARNGKSAYRVRYKPSEKQGQPLLMSGYGVELALKRTDYIVQDDRPKEQDSNGQTKEPEKSEIDLDDEEEVADMKPLSRSEVIGLSVKAAHFAVSSEKPIDTLLKMTQDFPKHSASLANHNTSEEFMAEYQYNREQFLPGGYNALWVNGVQYDPRKVDAFSLLDSLRSERKLISHFRNMGLTSAEAITLLAHPLLLEAHSQSQAKSQRYDWRDETEGGDVIMWLNNIEKDKRYKEWPSDLDSVSVICLHDPTSV
jgi:UDP-glucose:glycoprotein glucosyltransferase